LLICVTEVELSNDFFNFEPSNHYDLVCILVLFEKFRLGGFFNLVKLGENSGLT